MKMNPEVKKLWVEALRSGRYQQGTGYLKHGNSFCCLGVLCDISKQGRWDSADYYIAAETGGSSSKVLIDAVVRWAGLPNGFSRNNPFVLHNGKERALSELNDEYVPFTEIADIIEKQL